MTSMFDVIREQIKPDIAFWGGDSIPHNLAGNNKDSNAESLIKTAHTVFKSLAGVPIYMTLGNHESFPQDTFKFHSAHSNDILNSLVENMDPYPQMRWKDSKQTFSDWGYYSVPLTLKDGTHVPKTKIISING